MNAILRGTADATTSLVVKFAYSEWRPTRWYRTASSGRRYGLFNTHESALRFSQGVLMGWMKSNHVSVHSMRSAAYDTWLGDNIGFSTDRPARICLRDQFGRQMDTSVRSALLRAADMDAYGLSRVVSALRLKADVGELHPDDLAAWREVEDEFPFSRTLSSRSDERLHSNFTASICLWADDGRPISAVRAQTYSGADRENARVHTTVHAGAPHCEPEAGVAVFIPPIEGFSEETKRLADAARMLSICRSGRCHGPVVHRVAIPVP